MSSLKELQEKFQQSILNQDESVLDEIVDTSKEERETLLGVYQHAYGARLIEFLENDYPHTLNYVGDEIFQKLATDYYVAHPSDNPNARWFGRHFPDFISNHPELKDNPEVGDLVRLEHGLGIAFDAPSLPHLTLDDLRQLQPEDWPEMTFKVHPSTSRISLHSNAADLWTSLQRGEEGAQGKWTAMITEIICWRGETMARFRPMSYDEAMIWDEAKKGANFSQLCEMLGTYWPSEAAPAKAAGYLQAWVTSEFLVK